jgi:hypothetical protein
MMSTWFWHKTKYDMGTRGAPANVVEKTFNEMSSGPKKLMQSLMGRFEYRGDPSIFTESGSNDADVPNTKMHPLTSGTEIGVARLVILILRPSCMPKYQLALARS